MAAVTIVMAGDDTRLQAAHNRLFAAQEKALENFQKSVNKSKESQAKAEADLAARKAATEAEKARLDVIAKGQKLIEGQMTAQERYNASLAEAKSLHAAGAISADDLARRIEALNKQLHKESGEADRAKDSEAKLTEAHRKAESVIKSIQTPLEKYNARLAELKKLEEAGALSAEHLARAQKQAKEEMNKANDEIKKKNSLLGMAGEKIGSYVTGIGLAGVAAIALRKTWEQINKEQEQGLAALQQTQTADSRLLQISGSQEEFKSLQSQSDALSAETGVDRNVSREVMFSGVSEGFKEAVPEILRANQVLNPKSAASVAGQVPSLFQGKIGALESVDLTLRAAKESRLNFEDLAKSLPSAAEGGAIAKASPEETLATLSVLASRFKSGDVAADRIKAFGAVAGIDSGGMTEEQKATEQKKVETAQKELRTKEERVADIERKLNDKDTKKEAKPDLELRLSRAKRDVSEFDQTRLKMPEQREEFKGQGIVEVVKRLQAMGEGDRQKFLGSSQELNIAFTVLKEELPAIEKRLADLKQERASFSQGGGILRDQVAIANANPQMAAIKDEQIAQREKEIASATKNGISGAMASGAAAKAETNLMDDGFITKTAGSMVSKPAAQAAVAFGADQDQAAAFSTGFTRDIVRSSLTMGLLPPGMSRIASPDQTAVGKAGAEETETAKQSRVDESSFSGVNAPAKRVPQSESTAIGKVEATVLQPPPPPTNPTPALQPQALDASGLNAAADKMQEAAKLNLEAAKLNANQPAPTVSGAARAQAAGAR